MTAAYLPLRRAQLAAELRAKAQAKLDEVKGKARAKGAEPKGRRPKAGGGKAP